MPIIYDSLNNNFSISIYEDQDGKLLFPENEDKNKNIKIVSLFENKVAFLFIRQNRKLTIVCHVLASRIRGREMGLYIVYNALYSENVFKDFKKESEIAFNKMGFILEKDDYSEDVFKKNTIFDNIYVFDLPYKQQILDELELEVVKESLEDNEILTYSGGDLYYISAFIGSLLDNISTFSFCISPILCEICNINIKTNLKDSELKPIRHTKYKTLVKESLRAFESEKSRNLNEEEQKEDAAFRDFIYSVYQLQLCKVKNSDIIKHFLINFTHSNPLVDEFIVTLVDFTEYLAQNGNYSRNEYYKFFLTETFTQLFSNPKYRGMIDWERVGKVFINSPKSTEEVDFPKDAVPKENFSLNSNKENISKAIFIKKAFMTTKYLIQDIAYILNISLKKIMIVILGIVLLLTIFYFLIKRQSASNLLSFI